VATTLAESKQSRVTRKWYVVTRKYHSCICALVTLLFSKIVTIGFLNKPAESVCPAARWISSLLTPAMASQEQNECLLLWHK
jgi:hypothetical protein